MTSLLIELFKTPLDVVRGFVFWFSDLRTLALSSLVLLIGIGSFVGFAALTYQWGEGVGMGLLQAEYGPVVEWAVKIFVGILSAALSGVVALFVTLIISGFLLEFIVERMLVRNNLLVRPSRSLGEELQVALRAIGTQAARSLLILLIAGLTLVLSLFPLLIPIVFVLNCVILGMNLIDLPLSLLEIPLKKRIWLQITHLSIVFPLGFFYALLLPIPFMGIILLIPFYYSAVQKLGRIIPPPKVTNHH